MAQFTKELIGEYSYDVNPTSSNKTVVVADVLDGQVDRFASIILGGADDDDGYYIKVKVKNGRTIVLPPFKGTSYLTTLKPVEILYMEDADFPAGLTNNNRATQMELTATA